MDFRKNDIAVVTIEDMADDGAGIGKVGGFTLFVKDAVIGDVVEARITKTKKHYAYARLEKVLQPSPFRVEPKCAYHRQCGGCQLQALSYEKQLEYKQRRIRNNLIRIGGFAPEVVHGCMEPIVGMEEPFHYRNKAQYPVGTDREGNVVTGFYAGRTHSIIANTNCYLGVEENQQILEILLAYMKGHQVRAYDETTGQGLVRHVLIRKGFHSGEIMVCLVINAENKGRPFLPNQQELLEKWISIPGMTSISVSINTERTNVIMGREIHTLWGRDSISDQLCMRDMQSEGFPRTGKALTFHISPLSFYQVNPIQTEKLYSLALEYAGLTGEETVWDLYCGIGTISLFIAGKAKEVCGVEVVPQAVEDARANAERNGITNAVFYEGKAEEVLPEFHFLHPDVIVVDPPRKGCDAACLSTMLKMQPKRIVYVSCDSATLARDLKVLCEGGYELKRVRGVDQFGQSVHVETVVLLSQQKADDYIEVELELDELDLTSAESKATYKEIQEYVLKKHGLKVSNLYISQVKRKCGIEVGENYNLPKSDDSRQPQCPEEKEKAIKDALEHFGMV